MRRSLEGPDKLDSRSSL